MKSTALMNSHLEQMQLLQFWHIQGKLFGQVCMLENLFYAVASYNVYSFMFCRYDMEDAMVLNKAAVDRGMFHGQIYQVCYFSLAMVS